MPGPVNFALKAMKFAGSRTVLKAAGWAGALITIGELGWLAAKKGKILERFTHYYCEEGSPSCGKMIPDALIDDAVSSRAPQVSSFEVKCPHCPKGKRTIRPDEWRKMKAQRKKWS